MFDLSVSLKTLYYLPTVIVAATVDNAKEVSEESGDRNDEDESLWLESKGSGHSVLPEQRGIEP